MKKQTKIITAGVIGAALIATTTIFADSKNDHKDENYSLSNSRISIEQAMAKATELIPGKVVEAEFDVEHNRSIWEVELIGEDKQRYEVEIDANTGDVLSQERDDDDRKYHGKYDNDDR